MDQLKNKALGEIFKTRHESDAKYFLNLSIDLIAALCSIDKIKNGAEFPPDKETIKHVADSIDYLLNALEIAPQKFRNDLYNFKFIKFT